MIQFIQILKFPLAVLLQIGYTIFNAEWSYTVLKNVKQGYTDNGSYYIEEQYIKYDSFYHYFMYPKPEPSVTFKKTRFIDEPH